MKSINILRVDRLHLASGSLRKVDRLSVQHVNKLVCNKDAFIELEADTVTFVNVTFPVGIELVPINIKSELKIVRCNLTDVTILVDWLPTDRSVAISHSYLDRLSLKINAATFTMDGNHFAALSSTSGLMDIAYSDFLNLKNNQFETNYILSAMPDVVSSNSSLKFQTQSFSVESRRWLEHFKLEFVDATASEVTGESRGKGLTKTCEEQNTAHSTGNRIVTCPNVKTLGHFLDSETKSVPNWEHEPEKQKQTQTNQDVKSHSSKVLHHYSALSLITAVCLLILCNSKI